MEVILISLCMIVKNEEKRLSACINSISEIIDEIIVVDTGSTDDTPQIAQNHGVKLFFHDFNNDFSEVRNISIKHATKDWILFLDADEVLEEKSLCELKRIRKYKTF